MPKVIKPRLHQKKCKENVLKHFENYDRALGVMPCGSGKTITSLLIAKEMNAQSLIYAVPTLKLQEQALSVIDSLELLGLNCEVFCIGSNKNISKLNWKFPVHSSTSVVKIREFIDKKNDGKLKVFITTYQSSKKLQKASSGFQFEFGILDESHRLAGVKGKSFSTILFDKNINIKRRLSVTATPKYYDNDFNFLSMSNKKYFGKCVYEMLLDEAIENNICCDYRIKLLLIEEESFIGRKVINENRNILLYNQLNEIIKKEKIKKIISFHNRVYDAKHFADLFQGNKKYDSFTVSSKTVDFDQQLSKFKDSKFGIITNSSILATGYDYPKIKCVIMKDVTGSDVDLIQHFGRVLRKDGNKVATMVLPFFYKSSSWNCVYNAGEILRTNIALKNINLIDSKMFDKVDIIKSGNQGTVKNQTSFNRLKRLIGIKQTNK